MNEITDEQRAAVEWLRRTMNIQLEPHAGLLFDLLPSELTNPQPVLPTEPGTTIYGGCDQPRTMFRLDYGSSPRHWIDQYGDRHTDAEARDLMGEWEETPPSVPDRPQITREQLDEASGGKLGIIYINRLFALVNGPDRD